MSEPPLGHESLDPAPPATDVATTLDVINLSNRVGASMGCLVGSIFILIGVWLIVAGALGLDPGMTISGFGNDSPLFAGTVCFLIGGVLICGFAHLLMTMPSLICVEPDGRIRFERPAGEREFHLDDLVSILAVPMDEGDVRIEICFRGGMIRMPFSDNTDFHRLVSIVKRANPRARIDLSGLDRGWIWRR